MSAVTFRWEKKRWLRSTYPSPALRALLSLLLALINAVGSLFGEKERALLLHTQPGINKSLLLTGSPCAIDASLFQY